MDLLRSTKGQTPYGGGEDRDASRELTTRSKMAAQMRGNDREMALIADQILTRSFTSVL